MPPLSATCLVLALLALVVAPPAARADDDRSADARVATRCTGGAVGELRVRARDDGELRVDLVLRSRRAPSRWLVVVVHERRISFRGLVRADHRSSAATLRRELPDLFGPDTVTIRATGSAGQSCRASATVAGD